MNLQSKLSLIYLSFILVLVIGLGMAFFANNANTLEKDAYNNLSILVDRMSLQLDNLIGPMDFISINLLSNGDFFTSMKNLVAIDRNEVRNLRFINNAYMEINRALMNYTIGRDYYSVNVFNLMGDFFSSNFRFNKDNIGYEEIIKNTKWSDMVGQANGGIVIIPPNYDLWHGGEIQVFSVARTVRGTDFNVGYIQVQEPYKTLEQLLYVGEESGISVVVITRENELLYSSGVEGQLLDLYLDVAKRGESQPISISTPGHSSDQIATVAVSDYTGLSILLAQDRQMVMRPLSIIRTTLLLSAVAIITLSCIYILIFSGYLTKPLRQLKEEIEQTHFQNLPDQINLSSSNFNNDEIKALNTAFINLRERLYTSIDQEIKSRNLYLQASLESLQARVNPHFIYNILNLLSNRGIMHGDRVICDICKSIASMLRYSTSTVDLSATLADELEHVENYLNIMKTRFEHRLEYVIDVDSDLMTIKLPKIALQPLVENSINHGFVDVDRIMKIGIYGYKDGDRWIVEIHDNGQGFDHDKLKDLNEKIELARAKDQLAEDGQGIGGMGILNLYSRLMYYFDELGFDFSFFNKPEGGACIVLSNPLDFKGVRP